MKLSYYENGSQSIHDARETIGYAQALANHTRTCIEVYNWAPGTHKHNSLYLYLEPQE